MNEFGELDNLEAIKARDSLNVLGSVEEFPAQCREAWEETRGWELPVSYKNVKNVVISGMGGSLLGGRIVTSLGRETLKVPVTLSSDYGVPGCVNEESLVIGSSYSGNTEETVSAVVAAKERGAKIAVLCSGGKLLAMARENGWPVYEFKPEHNPSGQPRMALGYSVFGVLGVLSALNFMTFGGEEAETIISYLMRFQKELAIEVLSERNVAKQLAKFMWGKVPLLISGEHLTGSVWAMRNMLNENGKQLSFPLEVPELNHHLLEGVAFPRTNKENTAVILFESDLYSSLIQKRLRLTAEVMEKENIPVQKYHVAAGERYTQAFEVLQLAEYVAFYVSVLNEIDPGPIPWVDWFKDQIKK